MKLVLVMMQANLKQLVFFWVEKYRNLENVGVNFGSEFVFQVQYSHGVIQIEKEGNGKYVNDFFLSETDNKVNNISAIIGENGSGKSNLLAALRIALSHNWGNYNLGIKMCIRDRDSTRKSYETTLSALKEFKGEIKVKDINAKLLENFDKFLIKRGQESGKGEVKGSRYNRIKHMKTIILSLIHI